MSEEDPLRQVPETDLVEIADASLERQVVQQSLYLGDVRTDGMASPEEVEEIARRIERQVAERMPDLARTLARFVAHQQVPGLVEDATAVHLPGITVEVVGRIISHEVPLPADMPEQVRLLAADHLQSGEIRSWPIRLEWSTGIAPPPPGE